jgi:heme/copper-type cytochrome/quinol oxidase subunit 2
MTSWRSLAGVDAEWAGGAVRASILVAAVVALGGFSSAQAPAGRSVKVVAERFDFSPSRITVEAGTTLDIELTSEDTLHGFRIIGTDVNVTVPKRGRGSIRTTFHAEKPGRYVFECARMCGAGHNFMRGEIRVVETRQR